MPRTPSEARRVLTTIRPPCVERETGCGIRRPKSELQPANRRNTGEWADATAPRGPGQDVGWTTPVYVMQPMAGEAETLRNAAAVPYFKFKVVQGEVDTQKMNHWTVEQ